MERWHDFYLLTGTAAATLIGLMFVAISFAANSKAERKRHDVDAFVTPSLVYFSEVFVIAAATLAPVDVHTLGYMLAGLLAVNLPFGVWRLSYFFRRHREEAIERRMWIWSWMMPAVSQLVLAGGAYGLIFDDARGLAALAISVTVLLIVAVRNTWSLVIYLLETR